MEGLTKLTNAFPGPKPQTKAGPLHLEWTLAATPYRLSYEQGKIPWLVPKLTAAATSLHGSLNRWQPSHAHASCTTDCSVECYRRVRPRTCSPLPPPDVLYWSDQPSKPIESHTATYRRPRRQAREGNLKASVRVAPEGTIAVSPVPTACPLLLCLEGGISIANLTR